MKNLRHLLILTVIALAGWGCYPGDVTVSELDTVLTLFDDEEDFTRFQTFVLPDTVIHIGDEDDEISREFDDEIIAEVRQNLLALGYQEIDSVEVADVAVLVEVSRTDLLVGWNPCCWCDWWSWYWGCYDPYYPWGGGVVYSYPIGTMFISMFDVQNTDMGDMIPVPWGATINGLVQGSSQSIGSRIQSQIDQAFAQSPYLGR